MAEAPPLQPDSPDGVPDMSRAGSDAEMKWSQVWQLPVLLFGFGFLLIGLFLAMPSNESDDFHGALVNADLRIQQSKLDEAQTILEDIQERSGKMPKSEVGYYWQLWADLNFEKLYATGVVGNHGVEAALPMYRKIVTYYQDAMNKGRVLEGPSLRHYVRSLIALGKDDAALAVLDKQTGADAASRYLFLRDIIERRRTDHPQVDQQVLDAIEPLMTRFREDIKGLSDQAEAREQTIWADGFQTQLMMEAGTPQSAITYLLRQVQRLASQGGEADLAPLLVKLGQAYQAIDDTANARAQYLRAQQMVKPTDELNAPILVGLGQLELAQSTGQNVDAALEFFREADEEYPASTQSHISALIGRAECEAQLGDHALAARYFDLAVREMLDNTRSWDPRRKMASDAIRLQYDRAMDTDDYDTAKDYLDILALLQGNEPTAKLLLDLATTCEKIGNQRLAEAKEDAKREPGQPPLSDEARRLANQQAAAYFEKAARYYEQHADKVTIDQDDLHGLSLWAAAQNYDRAQLWPDAIRIYDEFIRTRDADPKRLRALRNLALAYMAEGDYIAALDKFSQLTEQYPRSPETYSSLVPMAKCLDQIGKTDQAVDKLNMVLDDNEAITPDSIEYKEALIALCKIYHRQGKDDPSLYARAIELLTEAVQRYGETEDGPVLRYLLADCNRLSVPAIDHKIATTQSIAAQHALRDERNDRLKQAEILYNQAISGLEAMRNVRLVLTPVQKVYLRNAYFYQADCAYDRGVYEQAIQLYNTAANNYAKDPASLIARVQMVNAYCELGQFQQARVVNDMARRQLERIPDSAFEDESLPMKRQQWEDWLRWTSDRKLFGSQASADTPNS